jgi:RHS repeat-associated protein
VTSGASTNSVQYTGRENDGTGLHYYRARYYHPRLQRFISEDPIGFGGGEWNLYVYVGNNPIRFNDPAGTDKCSGSVSMFGPNFWDNLVMTNAVLFSRPAQLVKFGAGMAVGTGKIFADAMGTVNPWAAVTATARGVRGLGGTAVRTGSISAAVAALGAAGVANLTLDATIASGAVTAGVGGIATSAALEGGIAFGSAYSAVIEVAEACRIVPDAPIRF